MTGVRTYVWRLGIFSTPCPGQRAGSGSARLLRPLVGVTGIVRKTVEVELPTGADATAVRDGLDKAPRGRSQGGHWLRQLAAGAPLEIWTDATGRDPDATWAMITDADARAGIISAVIARRDPDWARALLGDVHRGELLEIVPSADREALVLRQLITGAGSGTGGTTISARLGAVPGPWSLDFSRTVLDLLAARERELARSVAVLAARMPPEIVPDLHRLPDSLARQRNQLIQHLSLVHAITEAFK
ncbi:translation initiation factor IF-2 [Nocardioidaceae bacterium Broad-1]|nr:translation initiation factor IF-2 [Nocardioidaceae bacterium Broad-1]